MAETTYIHNGYRVHVFTQDAIFSTNKAISEAIILLVGGGGMGGSRSVADLAPGGGGAGGLLLITDATIMPGDHRITIGRGGSPAEPHGQDTTFLSYVAIGGGVGSPAMSGASMHGGSGGGGRGFARDSAAGGAGTSGQGHNGGSGYNDASVVGNQGGGGGGGAGGAGGNAARAVGGNGGPGVDLSEYFGTGVGDGGWFASGGAGGKRDASSGAGTASEGGGGNGGNSATPGGNGIDGTGGGGGGGSTGGNGGSGIVIIAYKEALPSNSVISGIVQMNGQPVSRLVRAFSYASVAHTVDGSTVMSAKTLGEAQSDPETGAYTIGLLDGYEGEVFVVAFDDYGRQYVPSEPVTLGERIHPTQPNGYVYECDAAGTLPEEEPIWSTDTGTSQLIGTASVRPLPFYRPVVHGPVIPMVVDPEEEGDS